MFDFVKRERRKGFYRTGVFSNLGAWDPEGPATAGGWLFSPPCARNTPFAAGAVTWRRRLGMVVQIHPSIAAHAGSIEAWVETWKKGILA